VPVIFYRVWDLHFSEKAFPELRILLCGFFGGVDPAMFGVYDLFSFRLVKLSPSD